MTKAITKIKKARSKRKAALPKFALGGSTYGQQPGQPSAAQNMISQAGPWGAIIGAASKIGTGIGDAVGGDLGGAIKGGFDPAAVLQNENLSTGQKILGTLGGPLGGVMAHRADKKAAEKARIKAEKQKDIQHTMANYQGETNPVYKSMFPDGGKVEMPRAKANDTMNPIAQYIHENVRPRGYSDDWGEIYNAGKGLLTGGGRPSEGDYREELWAKALGSQAPLEHLTGSKFRPTNATDPNAQYHALKNVDQNTMLQLAFQQLGNKDTAQGSRYIPITERNEGLTGKKTESGKTITDARVTDALGNYTFGRGEDDMGKYISYYDKWDFANPLLNAGAEALGGSPTEIYDRIYYDENNKPIQPKMPLTGPEEFAQGGMVDTMPIEVEGGESALLPNGGDVTFEGPNHNNGGIEVPNAPEGMQIASDRTKVPGTNKTFSDVNKKIIRDKKKATKVLDDPSATRVDRRTAELNLSNFEEKQQDMFALQERINQEKEANMNKKKFADGGTVTASDLEKLIKDHYSKLRESYKTKVKGGLGEYTTPGGATYNTGKLLQEKEDRVLGYLDMDGLREDPERIKKLYSFLTSQGVEKGTAEMEKAGIPWKDNFGEHPLASNFQKPQTSQAGIPWQSHFGKYPLLRNYPNEAAVAPQDPAMEIGGNPQGASNEVAGSTFRDTFPSTFNEDYFKPTNPYEAAFQAPEVEGYNSKVQYRDPAGGVSPQSLQSGATVPGADTATNAASAQTGSKFGNIASGIAAAAPALYNIGQGLFGKADTVDPNEFRNNQGYAAVEALKNRRYNERPELASNRRAYNVGRRDVRTAANTRGELLGNYGGLTDRKMAADSNVLANKQNIDNQYQGEAAQMQFRLGEGEARTAWNASQYNRQAQAAQDAMLGKGLSQVSELIQTRRRDKQLAANRTTADQRRWEALRTMFPDTYK